MLVRHSIRPGAATLLRGCSGKLNLCLEVGSKGIPLGRSWAMPGRYVPVRAAAFSETAETSSLQLPHIIETKNVPIHLYADLAEVEEQALKQLVRVAETAMPVGYISAMPDVHWGQGVTIGTVFASEEFVCPNAVGVDIGCGMCAVPIDGLHKDDLSEETKKDIQQQIKTAIPTGFFSHSTAKGRTLRPVIDEISQTHAPTKWLEAASSTNRVAEQLGTLGGGNHFLEVVHDETGRVWIMLHSGSRHIGLKTAQHYDGLAKEYLDKIGVSAGDQLNYMRIDSQEGQDYLQDMAWAQRYAFQNRAHMLDSMVDVVQRATGLSPDMSKAINIHHNYCQCERCSYTDPRSGQLVEKDLWVTRKGATSAKAGEYGIVPGSMGVGSFITVGRGNPDSWSSSSHGAGRLMSRTKAKNSISQEAFEASMKGVLLCIICDVDPAVRDEAPQAYKNLSQVMANQKDLTDVVHRLQTLVNVKGFGNSSRKYKGMGPVR